MNELIAWDMPSHIEESSATGKWKRYRHDKDSSVEWLGRVPKHWEVNRLKFYVITSPSKNEVHNLLEDLIVTFLPMECIGEDGKLTLTEERPLQQVSKGYTYFYTGDVVVAKITPCFENGKGAVCEGLTNNIGFGTTELHVLRPQKSLWARFLFYITKSPFFRVLGAAAMTGSAGQQRVPEEFIKNFLVGVPPLREQKAIATFLDRETTKINALIAKRECMIELLQERRVAVINQAVTKGLVPDVKMKESGVEWLGEIPEHWTIGKIGMECRVKARLGWKGLKASEYVDDGYIFLSTPDIKGKNIDFEHTNYITYERYLESPEIMLKEGDVLIAKDGSTLGTTNVVRYLPNPATVNSSIAVIRPKETINSVFLYWFLSSDYIYQYIQSIKNGMGVPHLFQADLRKFVVVRPPLDEQQEIAYFLDKETAKIDKLIAGIQQSIQKLKEYSTALISAAVTGKIDVRGEIDAVRHEESYKHVESVV